MSDTNTAITDDPSVAKFAKYRGGANDSLETIQNDIRKSFNDLLNHHQRLVAYADGLKQTLDAGLRVAG